MTHVTFLEVLTWTFVNFWMEVWTEVPSPSLAINEVPFTIRNELQGAKNKVVKPQGAKTYLTQKRKSNLNLQQLQTRPSYFP